MQRLKVQACRECNNNGWANDEAHFRNIMLIAGEPNKAIHEIWNTSTARSFKHADGKRRLTDLVEQIKLVHTSEGEQHKIYPGQDPQVTRILKKIIRGLCYYHKLITPIHEDNIFVDVMKYRLPPGLFEDMIADHREPNIFRYKYQDLRVIKGYIRLGF